MASGRSSPKKLLLKAGGIVVIAAVMAFAFWRSVHTARSEAYTLSAGSQRPWQLTIARASGPNDAVLLLEPPPDVSRELFDQVFKRSMESMGAPDIVGIPLVLQGELERAGSARISPDDLVAMARQAGLDGAVPAPRCMGHRRAPEPDTRQQAFFAIFDSPAFTTFRSNLAARLGANFDPAFLTPALFVGIVESRQPRWVPLHADAAQDCVAPIAIVN
jgi:hypothetical protein